MKKKALGLFVVFFSMLLFVNHQTADAKITTEKMDRYSNFDANDKNGNFRNLMIYENYFYGDYTSKRVKNLTIKILNGKTVKIKNGYIIKNHKRYSGTFTTTKVFWGYLNDDGKTWTKMDEWYKVTVKHGKFFSGTFYRDTYKVKHM